MTIEELQKKAARIRLNTLSATHKAGIGYVGSCMSVVEILVALYYGELLHQPVLHFDPRKPGWDEQDYLILSKGQAVATLYSVLADLEFFDENELNFLARVNSLLQSRPNGKVPGVAVSNISHGHGLSIGMGLALALKAERKSNRTFVVMGDGELQTGQVWEAAMAAANYNLNNLIAIVDNNKIQADGRVSSVMDLGYIQDKFEGFGWNVIQVRDGHNFDNLLDGLLRAFSSNRKPVCLWCHTVASKGIEFAEGKSSYQGAILSEVEMAEIIPKLEAQL